ncbi:hypothetical protein H4R19_006182, partial [Coemansia spiralis]
MGKRSILPSKSWHVSSSANKRRVQQDEEQAQGRSKNDLEGRDVRTLAQCTATPWYATRSRLPASVESAGGRAALLDGDPFIAMIMHDERVERRRRKHRDIAREAGLLCTDSSGPRRKKHQRDKAKSKRRNKSEEPADDMDAAPTRHYRRAPEPGTG